MVKIESDNENDFIKTTFLNASATFDAVWIGLSDQVIEGTWKWSDGSNLEPAGYTKWGDDNPNNSNNQDCVLIQIGESYGFQYDGHWDDVSCYLYSYPYICMK